MTQSLKQPLTSPDREAAITNAYDRWAKEAIITNGDLIPEPKFQIFELALLTFKDEDEGQWFVDLVQIMGMQVSSSTDPNEVWTYSVQYIAQPSESHMPVGLRSECANYYLQKVDPSQLRKSLTRAKDAHAASVTFRNRGFYTCQCQ